MANTENITTQKRKRKPNTISASIFGVDITVNIDEVVDNIKHSKEDTEIEYIDGKAQELN